MQLQKIALTVLSALWFIHAGTASAADLKAGGVYNAGFAVHDDNITTRGHQISFVKNLGLGVKKGTKVDFNAVKLQ